MKSFSAKQIQVHLEQCGLEKGQNLFVHSNMSALGVFVPGPAGLYDILRDILGDAATIVAPAYRITASPDEVFDPANSPSLGVGSFSEFLRRKSGVVRSLSPIHSHVFDGPLSSEVVQRGLSPSFGAGSDFEFLMGKSFRGLFLGCNFQPAGTLVFHAQAHANNIPYRQWETARRHVLTRTTDGNELEAEVTFPYYARKKGAPRENRAPVELALAERGLLCKRELPYGYSLSFDYDIVQAELLQLFKDVPSICLAEQVCPK
jgi:aminoglycoside N3'-acetyltransferase